ncbi:hypothetical protein BU17DRAFT_41299 [Hysterangium stoloniferum]|nr:hypothetical protein BU17DRAFT_41299 [Hysterangium stoloniferum]
MFSSSSESRSSSSLPIELWRPIIEQVSSKDSLASLARVCRFFQGEAERVLYRSVILHHNDHALFHALSSRRRAALVEECSLYLPPSPTNSRSNSNIKHTSQQGTQHTCPHLALLSRMRSLTSLSLRGPLPANSTAKSLSFPFRLTTFCTTEALSKPLITLLRLQPSITRLTLLNPVLPPCPSLAGALPNATALATLTPAPALAILPHRPVSHLHILAWANSSVAHVAPLIGASSGPLKALMCAQGLALSPSDLGLLAMHIPNLSFLGDLALTEDVAAYLPALATLPLRTLLINRASAGLDKRFSERAVVRAIGAVCAVERIAFTTRVTADYVWERRAAGEEWVKVKVEDPCEVAGDLWRAT